MISKLFYLNTLKFLDVVHLYSFKNSFHENFHFYFFFLYCSYKSVEFKFDKVFKSLKNGRTINLLHFRKRNIILRADGTCKYYFHQKNKSNGTNMEIIAEGKWQYIDNTSIKMILNGMNSGCKFIKLMN